MSDEPLRLLKLALSNELYEAHKGLLIDSMFPKPVDKLWQAIKEGHKTYQRDLSETEVYELVKVQNGTLTTAAKEAIQELLERVREMEPIGFDVGIEVIRTAYKHEVGRSIIEESYSFIENKPVDLDKLSKLVEQANANYLPIKEQVYVPTDPEELLSQFDNTPGWSFNLLNLHKFIPNGLHGGEFCVFFARPEMGKTAFWISLACGPGGWCDQGAKVHVLCNEEYAKRNMLRAISCATNRTADEIRADIPGTKRDFLIHNNIFMVDAMDWSIEDVNAYARKHKPDILIVDQLDKVRTNGDSGAPSHERLRTLYTGAREVAKRNDCVVVGISQASNDAEGKDTITYAMLEGSKTGKAAEADLMLGVGQNSFIEQIGGSGNETLRMITSSKNKLSGWHGQVHARIDALKSRYNACSAS